MVTTKPIRNVHAALDALPRARMAVLPTPLHEATRLRAALGGEARCPRILLKRDDLTDVGLGGNKARKLEYLLGDALACGATVLVTTGGPQSNHARMTAAAAGMAGLRAVLVLSYAGPPPALREGNLLLDRILGAQVELVPESAPGGEAAKVAEVVAALEAEGERPYLVPLGGSNAIGALGYVEATRELQVQLTELGVEPSRLYHASGSRGTQAGLELGARLFGAPYRVVGIAVSGSEGAKRARAAAVIGEASALLGERVEIDADELHTDQAYYGAGYAVPTAGGVEAMRLLARAEGVFLDPVYTGKAMAGLIDHVRRGVLDASETVVFLHTGGVPGLFAQGDAVLDMLEEHA